MKKVTKAIIPAAGFGTRFLPQTKAMPKEMLPIVDKPVIQYVVEECAASGIKDIIIVTGYGKRAIEDHFDTPNSELVNQLKSGGKIKMLEDVNRISQLANFIYVRQKGAYGNGTPVLSAQAAVGDEPFAVLWGDEFIYSKPPRLAQMLDVYNKYGGAVISAVRIKNKRDLSRYGIAEVQPIEGNVFKIKKIVEKPEPNEAPSNLATHGAYVLPPDIFQILKDQKPGKGGEIWLPVAIDTMIKSGYPVFACEIENGTYYDTGNKLEYLKTVVEFGLQHQDLNGDFRSYLRGLKL
ncbi:UTP--glucose-1-phosphate uridylyltransferase [Candidatus Gottesmanbacteria bacterium]|nr:UTP--glucose-1-phosphate uridylyltransferase [Candidatus Gottesmanbacteria bacterium]